MHLMLSLARLTAAVVLSISSASAAELVMFRRDGCSWCQAWDRDIGPIYGKTDIGQRAPIRMVYIDRDRTTITLSSPVIYTPTFVLVDKGREVGRIEGYPGDHFFWGLLERLVQQLPSGAASVLPSMPYIRTNEPGP
jgi:thioredoxin-related protein